MTSMANPCDIAADLEKYMVKEAPPTVYYIPNFITEGEEESLLQQVYRAPKPKWTQLSGRRLQNWGGLPNPKGMLAEKLPDWLLTYTEKISMLGAFSGKTANHVLINEYKPGEGIMSEIPQTEESRYMLSLLVQRRSLLILQDDMYKHYLHGIRGVYEDILSEHVVNLSSAGTQVGDTLPRSTRVSLTIRHVPKVIRANLLLGKK
nr:alpha-ketoglutarate-dependent dioxygenase alkB homolog 6 isoform X2 [Misgurnus anguillicaudatus]